MVDNKLLHPSSMHHAGRLLRGSLDLSMTLPTGVAAAEPLIAGMGIVPCELNTVADSAAVPAAEKSRMLEKWLKALADLIVFALYDQFRYLQSDVSVGRKSYSQTCYLCRLAVTA
jgi:hypothetical protein